MNELNDDNKDLFDDTESNVNVIKYFQDNVGVWIWKSMLDWK